MSRRELAEAGSVDARLALRWRVAITLTIISLVIGSIILAIFTGFGRPDVGAILIGLLFGPVVIGTWLEFGRLRSRLLASFRGSESIDQNDAPPA